MYPGWKICPHPFFGAGNRRYAHPIYEICKRPPLKGEIQVLPKLFPDWAANLKARVRPAPPMQAVAPANTPYLTPIQVKLRGNSPPYLQPNQATTPAVVT